MRIPPKASARIRGYFSSDFLHPPTIRPALSMRSFTCSTCRRLIQPRSFTSQLWGNFYLDEMDHRIAEGERCGAYLRYTDDFLLFGDDKTRLWKLDAVVREELTRLRLRIALPKSRLLSTREGVSFCGFLFRPRHSPRVLGATKRRFERRRYRLLLDGVRGADLSERIRSWYQFSREGNVEGLLRAYSVRR